MPDKLQGWIYIFYIFLTGVGGWIAANIWRILKDWRKFKADERRIKSEEEALEDKKARRDLEVYIVKQEKEILTLRAEIKELNEKYINVFEQYAVVRAELELIKRKYQAGE